MTERKTRRVRVVHDRVGNHSRGEIVDRSEFDNIDHLLALGAVVETDQDEEELERPSLYQAMRSESPPTLPNAPFVSDSEKDVQIAAGMVPPEHGNVPMGGASYVGPEELQHPPQTESHHEAKRPSKDEDTPHKKP